MTIAGNRRDHGEARHVTIGSLGSDAAVRAASSPLGNAMDGNEQDADTGFDDDLPDFSPPEWEGKITRAMVNPGEPIDLQSVRVRRGPDGITCVSYKSLPDRGAASGADAGIPPTDPDKG